MTVLTTTSLPPDRGTPEPREKVVLCLTVGGYTALEMSNTAQPSTHSRIWPGGEDYQMWILKLTVKVDNNARLASDEF